MELNIAVIDDLEHDREVIRNYLDRFFGEKHNCTIKTADYTSAEEFLKKYRKGMFEIIFLDVCLGEMDGLALADKIRIADHDISIIFMSTTRDFVFQSFPSQPKGFLCKPFEYADFVDVMDRTISDFNAEDKLLKVNIPHMVLEIPLSEIVSVLSNNHSVDVKLITGEVKQSIMLFSELESALENEPNFLFCNRGIIINMDYASQVKGDQIVMQDEMIYPVRRRGRKDILAKYTKYAASRMRRRLDI
ncbi:LytR/AlgR family response regulator transcription factor [Ruminococcus albus]|uniref:Stage 0 sporulation protein A homolog n=1 Tax=Ruminococcus albus TaxID=1264 RepID=A0A1I1Q4Q6_RUMAL|nr:LytTR family DNA-binding domain-containing protein [Ruminococcus albus]SFD13120.1 two component transcriptional regulator, LytTR family [Ruminococcus albus]